MRAIKAEGLEDAEENYGQVARYLGGMPEMPRYFDLTEELRLIKGREYAVSGNLAAILEQSRYGKYFEVTPRGAHRGGFDLARAQQALEMRRGKRKADLDYLNEACERCGIPSFYDRVNLRSEKQRGYVTRDDGADSRRIQVRRLQDARRDGRLA